MLKKMHRDRYGYYVLNKRWPPEKSALVFAFVLVLFYGTSTIVGYLIPIIFYTNKQFYFKQFSLALVHSLSVKTVLFQTIKYTSISIQFQSHKTVLFFLKFSLV